MRHAGKLDMSTILAVLRTGNQTRGVTVLKELERGTSRALIPGTISKTLLRLE